MPLAARLRNVEVDVPQFEAALLNLVVNARDAMENGGTITLTAADAGVEPWQWLREAYATTITFPTNTGFDQPDMRARALLDALKALKEAAGNEIKAALAAEGYPDKADPAAMNQVT